MNTMRSNKKTWKKSLNGTVIIKPIQRSSHVDLIVLKHANTKALLRL